MARLDIDQFAEFLISLGLLSECSSPSELLKELESKNKEAIITYNNTIYRVRKVDESSFDVIKGFMYD